MVLVGLGAEPLGHHARDERGHELVQVELDVNLRVTAQRLDGPHERLKPRHVPQGLGHLVLHELGEVGHQLVQAAVGGEGLQRGSEQRSLASFSAASHHRRDAVKVQLELLAQLVRHHGLDHGSGAVGSGFALDVRVVSAGRRLDVGRDHRRSEELGVRGASQVRGSIVRGQRGWVLGYERLDALDREPVRDDVDGDGRPRELRGEDILEVDLLVDRYVQLGVAGHFLERDGPGARGEAV